MQGVIQRAYRWCVYRRFFSTSIFVLICAAGVAYAYRAPLGWQVWESWHLAPIAAAFNNTDPTLSFAIGNYYFGGGAYDIAKAKKYYQATIVLDPTLSGVHYQLARIYFILGDFTLAEVEINKELELYPSWGRSHYVKGLIYGYSGRLQEAEKEFIAFLMWKPDSWAGNNDLAWIYFQEGKYKDAARVARAGIALAPDNVWLLNSLGVALLNLGDKQGAKDAFTKALEDLKPMSEADWGNAYPGNNPDIYTQGYTQMKASLEKNLTLLSTVDTPSP